ncbi:GMC family oxidoreductase N-terminal domain-containing protein [Novosphingobium colocasiae]
MALAERVRQDGRAQPLRRRRHRAAAGAGGIAPSKGRPETGPARRRWRQDIRQPASTGARAARGSASMDFKPDYIIVGAGSAGCVLANRLSADPACKVLLLEAGGSDGGLFYRMPAGFFELMKRGTGNWNFETVPQAGLDGRTIYFPRGKVLGGSSSINGLVVARGECGRLRSLGADGQSRLELGGLPALFPPHRKLPGQRRSGNARP